VTEPMKVSEMPRTYSGRAFKAAGILAALSLASFLAAFGLGVGPCSDGNGFLFLFALMLLAPCTVLVGIGACIQKATERRQLRRLEAAQVSRQ
jgi:hypothetical protein